LPRPTSIADKDHSHKNISCAEYYDEFRPQRQQQQQQQQQQQHGHGRFRHSALHVRTRRYDVVLHGNRQEGVR